MQNAGVSTWRCYFPALMEQSVQCPLRVWGIASTTPRHDANVVAIALCMLLMLNARSSIIGITYSSFEPPHDKTNKVAVQPAKTQISLGIRPVWSESSLSARRKLRSLATHWAHSEDSDQTGRMKGWSESSPGAQVISFILSCCGSFLSTDMVRGIWDSV